MVVQKLKKEYETSTDVAIKYFSIISVLNNLKLTEREIQLLAFITTKGSISFGGKRDEFISLYNSSVASMGNLVHKLKKKKLLMRIDGKIKVNPLFEIDFSNIKIELHINAKG